MTNSIAEQGPDAELFAGSRMKLQRARRFIGELAAEFDRYRKSDPVSARPIIKEGIGQVELRWEGYGLLPGAILGDTIHSLRTALDQMASELARLNNRSDRDVYFPFSDGPDTFDAAIKNRRFDKAGEDAVAVLRQFAPYRGGNDELRAIHDLDVEDKHTNLIVTMQDIKSEVSGRYDLDDFLKGEFIVAAEIDFLFSEGTALSGLPIIETLERLVEVVESILEAFAGLVAKRG